METTPAPEKIALAIGSNMGDRRDALRQVMAHIAPYVTVDAVSPVYETAPVYVTDQPPFLNATLIGSTKLLPLSLLWNLKKLEMEIGRTPTFRYGPRAIDIDILFYGQHVVALPELNIPHIRMAEREFVLRPLADIAPDWVHPQLGKTVQQLLADLPDDPSSRLGPLT